MTFEQRIKAIEKACGASVPGTQITRVPTMNGMKWCLAVGANHFYGNDFYDIVEGAERFFQIKKKRK